MKKSTPRRPVPLSDVALCVELGQRPVTALMGQADWNERVVRLLWHDMTDAEQARELRDLGLQ